MHRAPVGRRATPGLRALVGEPLIVQDGEIATIDMAPVIREHNRNTARLVVLHAGFVTVTDDVRNRPDIMRLRLHRATVRWLRLEGFAAWHGRRGGVGH